ncbi:cytochrome P450 [Streptomyces phaeofaciens JCM 4814]|uniref:Cytochrome P450 n=1 Tax=Streptomyces phaeofaciens TaxID=68254 RepID=A0A918HQP0_9ACTN|nr:cytochrome P450 [Streptomyces phaeofaciens]GGT93965.1 cytochrome P450 [Streptomyces phaeofaciens]
MTEERTYAALPAPGAAGIPVLGNVLDFRRDILKAMHRGHAAHGDLVRYRLGPVTVHGVSSPELAAAVLTDTDRFGKLGPDNPLRLVLGEGLLTSDDHKSWLRNRRMMQPIYTKQSLAGMFATMGVSAAEQISHMSARYRTGAALDLHQEMMRVTLDIVSRCMFSTDVSRTLAGLGPDAVDVAINYAFDRLQNPFSPPTHWPTPRNRRFHQVMRGLDDLIYRIIAERRQSPGPTGDGDLLDMLLAARDADTGKGMTDRELRDEVITTFAAGHETTAITLTWAFYLLSRHREVLRRVQREVDDVLGDELPTPENLAAMPYALRVFEEALRLYPSAPIVPRLVLRDTELGGYRVPAGSRILVNLYGIHRHPRHWPDPERFDPDRFLPDVTKGRHRFAYLPFGAGPHLCIGKHFALMEAHLLLTALVRRWEFRHVPSHRVVNHATITLRPRYGMLMTMHQRTTSAARPAQAR